MVVEKDWRNGRVRVLGMVVFATRAVCWRSEFAGVKLAGDGLLEFLRFSQLLEGKVFRRTTQQRWRQD